jgi:serine/threonine-protein kinase
VHYNLGKCLKEQGAIAAAADAYREAIRLDPSLPEAHCNLGKLLVQTGLYTDGLAALRRGHELGTKKPGWRYPSEQWVRDAELKAALDARVSAILSGKSQPSGIDERIALAGLCAEPKKLNVAAARFYAEAFAAEPKLADDMLAQHRYNAACAAALAGCGQGADTGTLDAVERSRLRRQALDWLTADLAAWAKLSEKPEARPQVRKDAGHWQKDSDLAGVRDAAALEKLPQAERAAWRELWKGLADLLDRTKDPPTPEAPEPKP